MSDKSMKRVATVVAIVMGVAGLLAVGFFIFMGIVLSSYGSSK